VAFSGNGQGQTSGELPATPKNYGKKQKASAYAEGLCNSIENPNRNV
jgi:hypothetical protein